MELRVHKVAQFASGGSHVTIYEAEVDLAPGSNVSVEILAVHPEGTDASSVQLAKDAIREGAEQVLQPRGLGAVIQVKRVVIHPVDFKPPKFALYTKEELTRLMPTIG